MKKATKKLGNPVGVKNYEGYLFLLPMLIPYLIFTFSMLISSFWMSFTNYKLNKPTSFVGLQNYQLLLNDAKFWSALWTTLKYVVLVTPMLLVIPFLLAMLMNADRLRARSFFRATFFYPQVIAVSIVTVMATYIFQPYTGLVNALLQQLHLLAPNVEILWLADRTMVWVTIVIMAVWRQAGYNMIIYLAGMQDISDSYYEAASLEGASAFQKMRYITIPCLASTHVLILFLQLIASFKVYASIYLLTGGGPGGSTRTYIQYLYETAFNKWQLGRGSASAIVLFLIILVVTQIQMKITSKYAD